jgi:hypothetical protein
MKRILYAAIGGVVLPFLYFILLWLVIGLVRALNGNAPSDASWFWLLSLPLEGGGRLYNRFYPAKFEPSFALLKSAAIMADCLASFLLFSTLTYLTLFFRDSGKARTVT